MVEKLRLPFPFLSDPDRMGAIAPLDVFDDRDPREIAIPTSILLAPGGKEVLRLASSDFADRPTEDTLIDASVSLGLAPTTQEAPLLGPIEPGARAFRVNDLPTYFRGAKFAAYAMSLRFPEAKQSSKVYGAQMDRYIAAIDAHLG
jgi:hypothetical protein